jgi:hypothetical protein
VDAQLNASLLKNLVSSPQPVQIHELGGSEDVRPRLVSSADTVGPSRAELLARAAAMGTARRPWESLTMIPTDAVLKAKMEPHVIERRSRLQKIVKGALAACLAFCVIATVASASAGLSQAPPKDASTAAKTSLHAASAATMGAPSTDVAQAATAEATSTGSPSAAHQEGSATAKAHVSVHPPSPGAKATKKNAPARIPRPGRAKHR